MLPGRIATAPAIAPSAATPDVTAALTGYLVIWFLIRWVATNRLDIFVYYRFAIAALVVLLVFLGLAALPVVTFLLTLYSVRPVAPVTGSLRLAVARAAVLTGAYRGSDGTLSVHGGRSADDIRLSAEGVILNGREYVAAGVHRDDVTPGDEQLDSVFPRGRLRHGLGAYRRHR